jgi:hypothetical protein
MFQVRAYHLIIKNSNIIYMITITEQNASHFIKSQLPDILNDPADNQSNIYQLMKRLVSITLGKVKDHNFIAVKKCFFAVEKLYDHSNKTVQNAIENVYVYSFTSMFNTDRTEKMKLLSIIPVGLYTIYVNQLKSCSLP